MALAFTACCAQSSISSVGCVGKKHRIFGKNIDMMNHDEVKRKCIYRYGEGELKIMIPYCKIKTFY